MKSGKVTFSKYEIVAVIHCPGHYVIYAADIIKDLYAAVSRTPFLWLDEVYITGQLAAKVGNSKPKYIIQLVEWLNGANIRQLFKAWKHFTLGSANKQRAQ